MGKIKNIKIINLDDGKCQYPDDWHRINPYGIPDGKGKFVSVVEAKNSKKYDVPHFVFATNMRQNSYKDIKKIYDACIEDWPKFKQIIEMQVAPPDISWHEDPSYYSMLKAHQESPFLGIFNIIATDDPCFDSGATVPYGIFIERNKK
ncbi:MAG: hypothetical protein IJI66_04085 [Erysipelotrichaceae bacterium]|nr:hypothetical protein [Erysipelotrichaceae bacterium]